MKLLIKIEEEDVETMLLTKSGVGISTQLIDIVFSDAAMEKLNTQFGERVKKEENY